MKIKPISLKEAAQRGLTVVRAGIRSYIPAPLPDGFDYHSRGQELLATQFEHHFENEADEQKGYGYCVQAVEDSRGIMGLPGTIYIARCFYSQETGIEDWTYYAALEVR